MLQMLGTAAAAECSLFSSYMLHRVSLWASAGSLTSSAVVSINWLTSSATFLGGFGREDSVADTSAGEKPAHVTALVPGGHPLKNKWISPNANVANTTIFDLNVNLNGTINTCMATVDVDISHTLLSNTVQLAILLRAVAGASANILYAASLDGSGVWNQIGDVETLTGL